MTRTFSKIHGLGGLRVGWGYGPAHVIDVLNRVRGPFNLSTAALAAAEAAIRDTAWTARCRAENAAQPRRARRGAGAASASPPTRREANFILARFRDAGRGRGLRPGAARRRASSSAGSRATSCRRRCASPSATPRPAPASPRSIADFMQGARMMPLPPRRADRPRADRLLDQPRHPPHRRRRSRITGHARTAETRAEAARLGLAEVCDTAAEAVEGADLVILCVPVGAMGAVAAEIAPRPRRPAPPSPTSARSSAR